MRTLVIGQARSGTTALFLQLQATSPADTIGIFEPATLHGLPTGNVLVKALVCSLPEDLRRPSVTTQGFDRCLVLVRDPRDRLISVLLFLLQWYSASYAPLWQQYPDSFAALLRLVRQKERQPASVTVRQLFDAILWIRFRLNPWQAWETWAALQARFLAWHAGLIHQETYRYEAVMAHAFPLSLPRAYASIKRDGRCDQWRQWFTPEDVRYFRPLLAPYLARYSYADDWTLPAEPTIDPALASRYVEKWRRVWEKQRYGAPTS